MTKASFRFDPETEEERQKASTTLEVETRVKQDDGTYGDVTEVFQLNEITGMEVLEAIATTTRGSDNSARGAYLFLHRVIRDEDWARFGEATRGAKPAQIGELVSQVINAYAGFPTTAESTSSSGDASTGSTSDSASETQASTSPEPVPVG